MQYPICASGVVVADKCPILLGKDGARVLAVEEPELGQPASATVLAERPSLALLLKKMPDRDGDVIGNQKKFYFKFCSRNLIKQLKFWWHNSLIQ